MILWLRSPSLAALLLALLSTDVGRVVAEDIVGYPDCKKNACYRAEGDHGGKYYTFQRVTSMPRRADDVSNSVVFVYLTYYFNNMPSNWRVQVITPIESSLKHITVGKISFNVKSDCGKSIDRVRFHCHHDNIYVGKYYVYDYKLSSDSGEHLNKAFGFDEGRVDTMTFYFGTHLIDGYYYNAHKIAQDPLDRYCSKQNPKLTPSPDFASDRSLKCEDTKMISYNYNYANTATPTLEDIICDATGWKVGLTYAGKHRDEHSLAVYCVESCTADLIDSCSTPSPCRKPNFAANEMTCDAGYILYAKDSKKVENTEIECKKKSFENADKSINIARVDPTTKAPVECLSKCHEEFIKNKAVTGALKITTDATNKLSLVCPDTKQFTMLKVGSKLMHSAKTIVCDPAKGWTAEDINNNAVFAEFDFDNKREANCVDVCTDRVDAASCGSTLDCKPPGYTTGSGKIDCGVEHVLRYQNADRIRNALPCSRDTIKTDEANAGKKLNVQCISNCAAEFVTGLKASNNKLTCPTATEIMIVKTARVSDARVFRGLTCDAAVGWKSAEGNTIVDFAKEVKLDVTCKDVCDDKMVIDQCSHIDPPCSCDGATPDCKPSVYHNADHGKYKAKILYCDDHYRAFINDKQCFDGAKKECAAQNIECKNDGWFGGLDRLFDFKDTSLDIQKTFSAACKHKCQPLFVEDSCKEGTVVAGKTTCSKAKYEKVGDEWRMSCAQANEIVVVEQEDDNGALIKKESFGEATCANAGWKDEKGTVMFALTKKFKVSARCEQLCHPDLLTGATVSTRSYALDAPLTCTAVKEMLEFDGKNVYSDLTCSKEGWTNAEGVPLIKFEANTLTNRQPTAQCVKSDCVRDIVNVPACTGLCSIPEFSKTKYIATCDFPKKLSKYKDRGGSPVSYNFLVCKWDKSTNAGAWYPPASTVPYLNQKDDFDLFCSTAECTQCTKQEKMMIPCDPMDSNCKAILFSVGEAHVCSKYACSRSYQYKYFDGTTNKYFVNEDSNAFMCSKGDEIVTPVVAADSAQYTLSEKGTMGCVLQIPCVEHSPLDLSCDGLEVECNAEKLTAKLTEGSQKGSGDVKCDAPDMLYLMTDVNKWTVIDHLKCDIRGEWVYPNPAKPSEAIEMTRTRKAAKQPKARVVCAPSDPTVQPVTAPPDPMTQTCYYCEKVMPGELSCDRCQVYGDHIHTETHDGVCTATSTTGRFMVNDGSSESKTLTCRKDENGDYKWKDDSGKEVSKLAAGALKITDRMNVWAIIGIVAASIAVLGAVAGLIVFGYVRRKREARRLEALKSKGMTMSQRIDTIIEKVSIEDPKTVRL